MGIKHLLSTAGKNIHSKMSAAYDTHAPVLSDYIKDAAEEAKKSKGKGFMDALKGDVSGVISTARENTFRPSNFKASNFDFTNFDLTPTANATGMTDLVKKFKNGEASTEDVEQLVSKMGGNKEAKQMENSAKTPSEKEAEKMIEGPDKDKADPFSLIGDFKGRMGLGNIIGSIGGKFDIGSATDTLKDFGLDPSLMIKTPEEDTTSVSDNHKSFTGQLPSTIHELVKSFAVNLSKYKENGKFESALANRDWGQQEARSKFAENNVDVENSWREISTIAEVAALIPSGGASALISFPTEILGGASYKELNPNQYFSEVNSEFSNIDIGSAKVESKANTELNLSDFKLDTSLPKMDVSSIENAISSGSGNIFDTSSFSELNGFDVKSTVNKEVDNFNIDDLLKKAGF